MNQTTKRILFSLMTIIVLLTACTPAPAATQDPALIQQLIEQSVQLTVAAQNLETAQAIPPATETPLPTETAISTPTPIIPSATPFVVVPPTAVVSGGGGGTTVKPALACDVITRPLDNAKFAKGDDFDVQWTIVNTGTQTWRKGLDLNYSYGPIMTNTTATIELPEMKPGDEFDILMDAAAPTEAGQHIMVWSLEGGFCSPYVAIIVK